MKFIIVFAALFAVALAAPPHKGEEVQVLRYDNDNIGVDGYNWAFETSDGTSAQAKGQLINAGAENEAIAVRGSYQFVGDDGVTYKVNYLADENGFQPEGAHLPVAPQA